MNIYKTIISNIKCFRKYKNITQRQLSELADYSFEYIRRIESPKYIEGGNPISIQVLYDISKALDIDIGLFFVEEIRYIKYIVSSGIIDKRKSEVLQMGIHETVAANLKRYINELDNSQEFKEMFPNITAIKWISNMTNIKERRIKNIMTLKAYPKIDELGRIADVIGIPIQKLVDDGTFEDDTKKG